MFAAAITEVDVLDIVCNDRSLRSRITQLNVLTTNESSLDLVNKIRKFIWFAVRKYHMAIFLVGDVFLRG